MPWAEGIYRVRRFKNGKKPVFRIVDPHGNYVKGKSGIHPKMFASFEAARSEALALNSPRPTTDKKE